jgi:hypothetical protein
MNSEPTNESSPSLSGQLLLASPALHDPNFARSVVFMAAHNAKDGAFGYILNRPLEQRVADLLPDQDLGSLGEVPVFMGGPVATDKLAFAALHWNKRRRTLRCQTHLSVADALHALSWGMMCAVSSATPAGAAASSKMSWSFVPGSPPVPSPSCSASKHPPRCGARSWRNWARVQSDGEDAGGRGAELSEIAVFRRQFIFSPSGSISEAEAMRVFMRGRCPLQITSRTPGRWRRGIWRWDRSAEGALFR